MAKLFIVGTPIGNMGDITQRVIETLQNVSFVLAEDTRVAQKLLDKLNIESKKLIRYDQHSYRNEERKLEILNLLLQEQDAALVTDAGTPGISDPGNELINWILESTDAVEIIPIPGVSSVTTALSVCGFDVSSYLFVGFLPKKGRGNIFIKAKELEVPLVFFESPFRVIKTLTELQEVVGGGKRIYVGRELTKLHEEHLRGTVENVLDDLQKRPTIKGELVIVLE